MSESIPIDEYNLKALHLMNTIDKKDKDIQQIRIREFQSFYEFLIDKYRKSNKKAKKLRIMKRVIELSGISLTRISTIGTGLFAILQPYLLPVIPFAISGTSAGISVLVVAVLTKLSLNAIHRKLMNKSLYHKQFADRIFELHKKVMNDNVFSKEEYEQFLLVKGQYHKPETEEVNNIFSQEEINLINEEIQSKMKEKKIKKAIKTKNFL